YLDVDGAMSFANVWINGQYAGGWPYGYASWRVDLTPFVKFGEENVIAIRVDNPPDSSRWYPGGGIHRNVWLVQTSPIHLGHWGTFVSTPDIDGKQATVKLELNLKNDSDVPATVRVKNEIFELDYKGRRGRAVGAVTTDELKIGSGSVATNSSLIIVKHPRLW